jgi:high-affinity nickel-transport protein
MDTAQGFGLALIVSAFVFGFRHGLDWDHLAAITDITSSQSSVRTGLRYATLYAAGHGVVVFLIGVIAIIAGSTLPESIDSLMGRVVGFTLVVLGVYVLYSLIRYRGDFRLRSRWMLLFAGGRSAFRWIRSRLGVWTKPTIHEHEHGSAHHETSTEPAPRGDARVGVRTALHTHTHAHTDPFVNYGTGTSLAVGALHGIGAETPTQVLIFLAAAEAGGAASGVVTLGVFLIGLFAANSLVALAGASGFLAATKRFTVYATVSVITAVVSLALGVSYLIGQDTWIPALFGG